MNMILLAGTFLRTSRPSELKKRKVENIFDAMAIITKQLDINLKNKNAVCKRWANKLLKEKIK